MQEWYTSENLIRDEISKKFCANWFWNEERCRVDGVDLYWQQLANSMVSILSTYFFFFVYNYLVVVYFFVLIILLGRGYVERNFDNFIN